MHAGRSLTTYRDSIAGAVSFALGIGLFGAASGCTAILGMDAPGLSCIEECPDAARIVTEAEAGTTTDPPPVKTGDDGSAFDGPANTVTFDSAFDSDASGGDSSAPQYGVSCGAAGSCSGATPVCCANGGDASGGAFQCVATLASCVGPDAYAVACDSDNLCPGTDEACCHYPSSTKCVPIDQSTQTCPGNAVAEVCDPRVANGCGAGLSCKLVGAGVASPYYACQR